jgi:holo-[acyl-carrier protein] synthase
MSMGSEDAGSGVAGASYLEAPSVEFNVGLDVEDVERFASVSNDPGMAGLFTPGEHEHCAISPDAAGRYAGTWCAKEAAIKALWPWVKLDPRRVEVLRADDGRPGVVVSGWDAAASGVTVRVSISHGRSFASACAVAWGPPPSPTLAHSP